MNIANLDTLYLWSFMHTLLIILFPKNNIIVIVLLVSNFTYSFLFVRFITSFLLFIFAWATSCPCKIDSRVCLLFATISLRCFSHYFFWSFIKLLSFLITLNHLLTWKVILIGFLYCSFGVKYFLFTILNCGP